MWLNSERWLLVYHLVCLFLCSAWSLAPSSRWPPRQLPSSSMPRPGFMPSQLSLIKFLYAVHKSTHLCALAWTKYISNNHSRSHSQLCTIYGQEFTTDLSCVSLEAAHRNVPALESNPQPSGCEVPLLLALLTDFQILPPWELLCHKTLTIGRTSH